MQAVPFKVLEYCNECPLTLYTKIYIFEKYIYWVKVYNTYIHNTILKCSVIAPQKC